MKFSTSNDYDRVKTRMLGINSIHRVGQFLVVQKFVWNFSLKILSILSNILQWWSCKSELLTSLMSISDAKSGRKRWKIMNSVEKHLSNLFTLFVGSIWWADFVAWKTCLRRLWGLLERVLWMSGPRNSDCTQEEEWEPDRSSLCTWRSNYLFASTLSYAFRHNCLGTSW